MEIGEEDDLLQKLACKFIHKQGNQDLSPYQNKMTMFLSAKNGFYIHFFQHVRLFCRARLLGITEHPEV